MTLTRMQKLAQIVLLQKRYDCALELNRKAYEGYVNTKGKESSAAKACEKQYAEILEAKEEAENSTSSTSAPIEGPKVTECKLRRA